MSSTHFDIDIKMLSFLLGKYIDYILQSFEKKYSFDSN